MKLWDPRVANTNPSTTPLVANTNPNIFPPVADTNPNTTTPWPTPTPTPSTTATAPRSTVGFRKTVEKHVLLEDLLQEVGFEQAANCAFINPQSLSMSAMLRPLVPMPTG